MTGTISANPDSGSGQTSGALPLLAMRNSYDLAGRLVRVETLTLAAWQSEGGGAGELGLPVTVT